MDRLFYCSLSSAFRDRCKQVCTWTFLLLQHQYFAFFLKSGFFSLLFIFLQVSLNDSHNQMVVHWAGEKSNVIVALARDSLAFMSPKLSDVSVVWGVVLCSFLFRGCHIQLLPLIPLILNMFPFKMSHKLLSMLCLNRSKFLVPFKICEAASLKHC